MLQSVPFFEHTKQSRPQQSDLNEIVKVSRVELTPRLLVATITSIGPRTAGFTVPVPSRATTRKHGDEFLRRCNGGLSRNHAQLEEAIGKLKAQRLYGAENQCPAVDYYNADLIAN
jgi:hypothetical protein